MKKTTRILVPLVLVLLILASIVWYLFVYDRDFTRDTLLNQARFNDLHGNARLSSWFYDVAYNFSGHDENVAIELANQYKHDGNFTKAEVTLTTAINASPTPELYTALCKTYVEQDKLLDAVSLLDNVSNDAIRQELDTLRPEAPKADFDAGYYSQYMDIRLYSKDASIYYTMDGTYPTTAGSIYSEGILLPAGETTIYAIAVNKLGLVSPVTVLGYTITGIIEEVVFTDPAMEAAIRLAVGADENDTILTSDLWTITEFTVPEGVTNFSDLSLMTSLKKLTVPKHKLDTLTHLTPLTSLETLDLTGSRFPIDEIPVFTSLPSLKNLILAECGISTIAGLSNAPVLQMLDLSSNTVRNLDVLSTMQTLVELNLKHNAVTDLSALGALQSLERLDVSFNALTTVEPIGTCPKLSWLCADNNQLNTLRGVDTLSMLTYLSVDYNKLDNVERLATCTGLTDLHIASNDIADISCLKNLTNLKLLDFSGNQVAALPEWPEGCPLQTIDGSYNALESIDGLKNMQSMTHVYMDYNLLTSIDALADCFCLVQVNVYGNPIPDVSALRDHDIIVNYDPTLAKAEAE